MSELVDQIFQDLKDRSKWEERQTVWYRMRHDGLRRKTKPWPGAADMHFPLADSMIEKLKPFYAAVALYSSETVASFTAAEPETTGLATGLDYWFDWKLKQRSNLELSTLVLADKMLMAGASVLKTRWDEGGKRLAFEAVSPTMFCVPVATRDLQDADRAVHIQRFSSAAYKREASFNQDADFLKRISGKGQQDGTTGADRQDKYRREGVTLGTNEDEVIVWEVWEKKSDGWYVSWVSPMLPEEKVRAEMKLVYRHGQLPFVGFFQEVKDEDYYSARGVPEIVAAFEASLNKQWNEKHDAMTLVNRPLYTADGQVSNTGNLKLIPGQFVPGNLRSVVQQAPSMSWDQEMNGTRMVAEYRVGMPDYGVGQANSGKDNKTATEVERIAMLMGQGTDLRGRIFRLSFARVLNQAWSLLQQFDAASLDYFVRGECKILDAKALQGEYVVQPNGSADNASKQLVLQKAVFRMNTFRGDPFVQQRELRRSVLEADDPRLVSRLLVDPQQDGYEQGEEQADEISNMLIGYPVQPSPTDDDLVHLVTLVQFIERRAATREAIPHDAAALMMKHGSDHFQRASQNKELAPQLAQLRPQMERAIGWLAGLVEAARQAQGAPGGVSGGLPSAPSAPPEGGQP